MSEAQTPDEMAKAQALAKKIQAKVDSLLAPLEREMKIMKWPAEYCSIVWEAVAMKAINNARDQ